MKSWWLSVRARDFLICATILIVPVHSSDARAAEIVTIHADRSLGTMPLEPLGFLHGVDEQALPLDDSLVATLRPQHWRLYKFVSYELATHHDPTITYGLSDHYAWSQGGFPEARPWEDWEHYEQYIANELAAIYYYFPDNKPAFFDIWNEPDLDYFWSGTYTQLLELFARCWNVVKTFDPDAKLVGPSVARYRPSDGGVRDVVGFLEDLDQQYDIRLDAISWHENDSGNYGGDLPERIPQHAWDLRMRLAQVFPPEYQPELHINEYAGSQVHFSPGYNVGYLYYLIEAEINAAMRACWWVYSEVATPFEVWSDCWNGLNAMFMNDGITPQIPYWVYKTYADMAGSQRIETEIPNSTTNVLASRDNAAETIRLLVGRYHQYDTADMVIEVDGYPYQHESVRIRGGRIPHFDAFFENPYPMAIPFSGGPIDTWETTVPVIDGSFEIGIDSFADNDAYVVTIVPDPLTGIAGAARDDDPPIAIAVASPVLGGSSTTIQVHLSKAMEITLSVFDLTGRRLDVLFDGFMDTGDRFVSWDGTDGTDRPLPSGVYFLRLEAGQRLAAERVVLTR